MAELSSLNELNDCFRAASRIIDERLAQYLIFFNERVVTRAKSSLGTYQDGWAPLAESTMRIRVSLGYTPDDPLLRSGNMHDETYGVVSKHGDSFEVDVGSEADYAWRQELGDGHTPARPWLTPALLEECKKIEEELSALIYESLAEAFGV